MIVPAKKQKLIRAILLSLLLILLVFLIYLTVFSLKTQKFPQLSTASITPTKEYISPTKEPESELRIYINKSFGFSFEHPNSFRIDEKDSEESLVYLRLKEKTSAAIVVIVQDNPKQISLEEWFSGKEKRARGSVVFPLTELKYKQIAFNGNPWYSFEDNLIPPQFPANANLYWATQNKDKIYFLGLINLNFNDYKDTVYQILSSFAFGEKTWPS